MSISTTFHAHRIINRVTRIWSELDYTQRRLLEIRTGVQLTHRESARIGADELEALYALHSPRQPVARNRATPDTRHPTTGERDCWWIRESAEAELST